MDKKTKMILGVGVLGVAAYLIWKSQQPKNTAGLLSTRTGAFSTEASKKCPCQNVKSTNTLTREDGTKVTEYVCGNDTPTSPHRCLEKS
jgi:hypothetical protein